MPEQVRAHTARTGLGGIFLRVTTAGTIAEGDTLRLVNRPHPAWTLARVAHLLYSEAVDAKCKCSRSLCVFFRDSKQRLHRHDRAVAWHEG